MREIYELIEAWLDEAQAAGEAYDVAHVLGDERFERAAAMAYENAARNVAWAVHKLVSSRNLGAARRPRRPRVAFEILERNWIVIRDQAEASGARASKGRHGKQAARLSKAAERFNRTAGEYARVMRDEMKRRGIWSIELARELGLIYWLHEEA